MNIGALLQSRFAMFAWLNEKWLTERISFARSLALEPIQQNEVLVVVAVVPGGFCALTKHGLRYLNCTDATFQDKFDVLSSGIHFVLSV